MLPSSTSPVPARFMTVVGFFQMSSASSVCTPALAVPEMLCVSGPVTLICSVVTMPIRKPKTPPAS